MEIFSLSTLNVTILGLLAAGDHTGQELRKRLAEEGYRRTPGAFYQTMDRLEDQGLVAGVLGERGGRVPGLIEKTYHLTAAGSEVLARVRGLHRKLGIA